MVRIALTLVSFVVAVAARTRLCANNPTEEKILAHEKHFKSLLASNASSFAKAVTSPVIPVYWHIIASGGHPALGNLTTAQIATQMHVLNRDYSKTGLSFQLANTTRTINADWFNGVAPNNTLQTTMKKQLRQGGVNALNLYSVSFDNPSSQGLLGYSTFPNDYQANPSDDGVVFSFKSLPGGPIEPFSEGRTVTHETGHWVGLYHTFQGGCSGAGDQVTDTPAESAPGSGCKTLDSCPDSPGTDPIHNFMDYTDDSCMTEFTPGQIVRMKQQMATYRSVSF